jgi:hypothetical protein
MSSRTHVEMSVFLRAFAIAFVVFNHSYGKLSGSFGLSGGMIFLMMMTGYNFARFGLNGGEPAVVRRSLVALGSAIVIPSVVMVLLSWPIQGIDWRDLILITNWSRISGRRSSPSNIPRCSGRCV